MLAFAVVPRITPQLRWIPWVVAAIVIVLTCIARVWAGAHWPSDVIGGVLLALGWCSFVLWLPERWLPSPKWNWGAAAGGEIERAPPPEARLNSGARSQPTARRPEANRLPR